MVLAGPPARVDVARRGEPRQTGYVVEVHAPLGVFGLQRVRLDEPVVVRAQQYAVGQACFSACPPGKDVVGFACRRRCGTAREDASLVPLRQRGPDRGGEHPVEASHVQGARCGAEDYGDQPRVTGQPPRLTRREIIESVMAEDLDAAEARGQGLEVQRDVHLGAVTAAPGELPATPSAVLSSMLRWPVVRRVWLPAWLADPESVVDELVEAVSNPPGPEAVTAPAPVQPTAESGPSPRGGTPPTMPPHPVGANVPAAAPEAPPEPAQLARGAQASAPPASPRRSTLPPFEPWTKNHRLGRDLLDGLGVNRGADQAGREILARIIAKEGPVQGLRMARLLANSCDLHRLAEKRVTDILRVAPVRPDEHGFYWPSDAAPAEWTGFRPDPAQSRAVEEISPVELGNAMAHACRETGGLAEEELFSEALALFGYKRRTEKAVAWLSLALREAVARGRLSQQGEYYHPAG